MHVVMFYESEWVHVHKPDLCSHSPPQDSLNLMIVVPAPPLIRPANLVTVLHWRGSPAVPEQPTLLMITTIYSHISLIHHMYL